nr:MAG: hypothetical protein [Bacteriophage sp.]
MNLDKFLAAIGGASTMKEFKRNLGMEGDRSLDVLITVLCGCVADRVKAVKHPVEFYADIAETHNGPTGDRAALLSRALSDMNEVLRDD